MKDKKNTFPFITLLHCTFRADFDELRPLKAKLTFEHHQTTINKIHPSHFRTKGERISGGSRALIKKKKKNVFCKVLAISLCIAYSKSK